MGWRNKSQCWPIELTHALQDQHTDLEKWSDQTPSDVSHNSSEDSSHIAKDELDTPREAVIEGQATAVMMDNILKPMGKSLIEDPEVVDFIKQQMAGSENSPVLARAPLLLSESLLFPLSRGSEFRTGYLDGSGSNCRVPAPSIDRRHLPGRLSTRANTRRGMCRLCLCSRIFTPGGSDVSALRYWAGGPT